MNRARAFVGKHTNMRGDGDPGDDAESQERDDRRAPTEHRESRWVVCQRIDGSVTVERLRGKLSGNLIRRSFVGSRSECRGRAEEWKK